MVGVASWVGGAAWWAFTDLGWAFGTGDGFGLDSLWSDAWWVGDVNADASPDLAASHSGLDGVFAWIVTSWFLWSGWALAFLSIASAVSDWHLNRDLWMDTVGLWWVWWANAFKIWAAADSDIVDSLFWVSARWSSGNWWALAFVGPASGALNWNFDRFLWQDAVGPWGWGSAPTSGRWAEAAGDVISFVVLVVFGLTDSVSLWSVWWALALVVDAARG